MTSAAVGSWTFPIGRWRGVEVRLHVLFPILLLSALFVASRSNELWYRLPVPPLSRAPSSPTVLWAFAVLLASVAVHETIKALVAHRVGGRSPLVILGPWGGGAQPVLPPDPPAHLVTAVMGPLTYLVMAVIAACLLTVLGNDKLVEIVRPFSPQFGFGASRLQFILQLFVWTNSWLLLLNMLPVAPFDGAEVLRGMLWPLMGRTTAAAASAYVAYGASAMTAVLAIVMQQNEGDHTLSLWLPLGIVSVLLLFGGSRAARQGRYDAGLEIDELESDDDMWLAAEWQEEERAAVLVERLEEKQQEALDRKRREREDREDARVDDILARIQEVGVEKLSDEEQTILKRAARRYRERRGGTDA